MRKLKGILLMLPLILLIIFGFLFSADEFGKKLVIGILAILFFIGILISFGKGLDLLID